MSASRGIAWVTGAAGFFGSHAANRLVRDGWTVYGIGHQPAHPDGLARSRLAGWLPGTVNDENLSRLFAMSERP
ncbi:MAG: NAD-dependent epimerase/dehydratase family protein, partial [Acetobacterales bacterium]